MTFMLTKKDLGAFRRPRTNSTKNGSSNIVQSTFGWKLTSDAPAACQPGVKYEAPQNINVSWVENNLSLSWTAAEKYPALVEVLFRRDESPTELWENRTTNTTIKTSKHQVTVDNLLKHTAYQVQIRHRSNQAHNPLWSDWSPVVTVPAELEQKPEVSMTTTLEKGTRKVVLIWKPMPQAAAATGVTYSLWDTQSGRGCPCARGIHHTISTKHTTYVSLSAVNISVVARNAAGHSPQAVIQLPTTPAADLKTCNKTLLDKKLNKRTCIELYELQDGNSMPKNVITLSGMKKQKERNHIKRTVKDFVRYLYFEHKCVGGRPQTVKMCLFYQKEGVPLSEPQDFSPFSETHNSVSLSWKANPLADHQGFLTHYSLCSVKISSQKETKECYNISASVRKHCLKKLTPGTKYNITLAGVTREGEGPKATITINTLPEKPANVLLWSLSLLFVFFLISTTCTCFLQRMKDKIFPPVPTPVIPNFTASNPEKQEMLERKEEVNELTLHQLHPKRKPVPEDGEETTVDGGGWGDGTDVENERDDSVMLGGSSDGSLCPDSTDPGLKNSREEEMTALEQVDNEIAMLIYRNGLVFDVKTDSP
uniref:leukemia inhibitory factor receptor isoform X1 n=1 Tax=Scatophagus argus TaxID=75038 RepID=UPI001ED7E35A|nr:leukemia inhibitory factor receptor isoform X1 [Scatophagus argus]